MNDIKLLAQKYGTPLILFSNNEFVKVYKTFQKYLPKVKHHYSLKPLPMKECIDAVADCNGYIDIASIGELELLKASNPKMLSKCIFTHPIKTEADIEVLISNEIIIMVIENLVELKKFEKHAKYVNLLIRLAFPNEEALCNLSEKFGADEEKFKKLLVHAQKLKINIIGCCFHVGSQMLHPEKFVSSIKKCRKLYDWAYENHGIAFKVLDIGGGFPAQFDNSIMSLKEFCKPIKEVLDKLFPDVEIWSEPGRSVAANSMMVVTQVIGKSYKKNHVWYYLNDGAYSTFSGLLFENMKYPLHTFEKTTEKPLLSVFAGPTCDSVDILDKDIVFQHLNVGDFLFAKRIGAYGWSTRTSFNLLSAPKILCYNFDLNHVEKFIEENEKK